MTGTTPLRVAVVGAGWIGQRHAESLARRADVTVAAICDLDQARAAAVAAGAARLGGPDAQPPETYSDWRRLVDEVQLDALWICTPPRAHEQVAVTALDRSLPLYLEKPIARTVHEARPIVEAAARSETVCAIGYQWHAVDLLDDLRRALGGRTAGYLLGQSVGGTKSRGWFLQRAEGGGNLLERGSHHIDLVRAVAGEVTKVQAAASSVRLSPRGDGEGKGDIDDAVTLVLHMETGAIATIVVAWTSEDTPSSYRLEVYAQDAALRLDLDPDFALSGVVDHEPVAAVSATDPFERSIQAFVDAVRDRDPSGVFCTPQNAIRTLAVAAAAEAALQGGTTIDVPEP